MSTPIRHAIELSEEEYALLRHALRDVAASALPNLDAARQLDALRKRLGALHLQMYEEGRDNEWNPTGKALLQWAARFDAALTETE